MVVDKLLVFNYKCLLWKKGIKLVSCKNLSVFGVLRMKRFFFSYLMRGKFIIYMYIVVLK